jgi:hypothetical protein
MTGIVAGHMIFYILKQGVCLSLILVPIAEKYADLCGLVSVEANLEIPPCSGSEAV